MRYKEKRKHQAQSHIVARLFATQKYYLRRISSVTAQTTICRGIETEHGNGLASVTSDVLQSMPR